jgi:hypothetical protein
VSALAQVFAALNQMREEGVVEQYAIGGATAVLFYAEPTRTYDVDVFVILARAQDDALTSLGPVYDWARANGFDVDAEHVLVHNVPVQILPAWSPLVVEAIGSARVHDYDGVSVRVVDPDCLVALALQAGGARRRERAWQLVESGTVDRARVRDLSRRHHIDAVIPDDV